MLTFDTASHLTSVGTVLTAGYNAEGLRAWKQSSAGTTYFVYDGLTPIAEANSSGTVTAVNTWGAAGLLSRRSVSSSSSTFYTFDVQGSTAQRLDLNGNVLGSYSFDAYGTRASTDNSSDPYTGFGAQFGYYRDAETGLSLLGHRYYDPGQGRFLNRDPIGYNGGLNLYGYVGNNPMGGIDPRGLYWEVPGGWIDDGVGNAYAPDYVPPAGSSGAQGGRLTPGNPGDIGGPLAGAAVGGIAIGFAGGTAAQQAAELAACASIPVTPLADVPALPPGMQPILEDALNHLNNHKRPPYARKPWWKWGQSPDRIPFYNLPQAVNWQEYYLPDPGASNPTGQPGAFRLVISTHGNIGIYSQDHMTTWYRLW